MCKKTENKIKDIEFDITVCNTVFNRAAYDFCKVLLMKYADTIPGLQMERHLFDEPYSQFRDREYNRSKDNFQEMLRNYCKDYKDDVNDLKKDNLKKEGEIKAKEKEIEDKDKALSEATDRLQASAKEIETYKLEARFQEDVYRRTRQKLDDERRERKNLQAELDNAKKEIQRLTEENDRLRRENASLQKELLGKKQS